MDTDGAGTPTRLQHLRPGVDQPHPARRTACGQYHYDSRGSTIAMTDVAENVVQQYAYDPFGRMANTDGSEANPFGFLGRHGVLDEGDDLSYIRARYFDRKQQRFTGKDKNAGQEQVTQTLNRYIYSLNSPLRLVDISGFHAKEIVSIKDGEEEQIHGLTIC
jgi:RHS repeat-associated protein